MQWKPDDTFVVTKPSAPFFGARGTVKRTDFPYPYPITADVETADGIKTSWFRLDEIEPAQADAPTEQLPAVTG